MSDFLFPFLHIWPYLEAKAFHKKLQGLRELLTESQDATSNFKRCLGHLFWTIHLLHTLWIKTVIMVKYILHVHYCAVESEKKRS